MHTVALKKELKSEGDTPPLPRPAVVHQPRTRRPVRSLFWPIFSWFWLAMIVLSLAVTLTVYFADPEQFFPQWRSVPLRQMDGLATQSIAAYEGGGSQSLYSVLTHLPPPAPKEKGVQDFEVERAYLYDANSGKELSGQKAPRNVENLVARARHKGDVQLQRLVDELLMARYYPGADGGRHYVLMIGMPRPSLLVPTRFRGWVAVSTALVSSALVCLALTRYFVGPLRRLQGAARRLAGGDLRARVLTTPSFARRNDEFGELAADFDHMATRIEDLLTAQRRLIGDISHELGSPLTRVNVALGLAFRKAGEEVRPELDRIQREAHRLNELIRQLLIISELENGAPVEPSEFVDLPALVREVAADAEFEATNRRCRVRVQDETQNAGGESGKVRGVGHLLRSAIENVVRNAVRYTSEDSEVSITISRREDRQITSGCLLIHVRDHGPGVPASALKDLFQPFYRVQEARDRQSGGTGLGLAITHQAVEAHGGTVKAFNHPGGGLAVEIELPV